MPKASVNEDDCAARGEHQVGGSGEVAAMETIAITHGMQGSAHDHFGTSVFTVDPPHKL